VAADVAASATARRAQTIKLEAHYRQQHAPRIENDATPTRSPHLLGSASTFTLTRQAMCATPRIARHLVSASARASG
jgi:hypothetical protein